VPEELLAPGFHIESHTAAALDYSYRGPSGWREWTSDLFEAFADGAHYEMRELIAADHALVIAAFTVAGASVWSGNPLQFSWVGVTWFRDGQATRAVGVTSRADALAASEQHSA
jgi:ketosteroid isomerase-like protein